MKTQLMRSRSGPDSKLHLEILVGQPNAEFDVEIVVHQPHPPSADWPEGYFDLFGSITDETFVRPPPPVELG